MHHLESLIQAIPPAVFAAGGSSAFANMPSSSPDPTSPHATFGSSTHAFPPTAPPPSLNTFPLMNPSTHFKPTAAGESRQSSPNVVGNGTESNGDSHGVVDHMPQESARMCLSSSYLYLDDEGYTRWQGETSGLPILDLLVERHSPSPKRERDVSPQEESWSTKSPYATSGLWFPDRTPKRTDINPEKIWKLITSFISPDLMDKCALRLIPPQMCELMLGVWF